MEQPSPWILAKDQHFEIYSDAGEPAARSILASFEQLRAWFLERTKLTLGARPPVRVLAFRSANEYRQYRLGPASDAHYIGTESQDFIAMPLDGGAFAIAAHEYAHLMLHASGLNLPPWLSEGLAEFFSTLRIEPGGTEVGGLLPTRQQTLKRKPWIPLDVVLNTPAASLLLADRDWRNLFYAESWALTEMLALAPEFAPRFDALVKSLAGERMRSTPFEQVYGKSAAAIEQDLRNWLSQEAFAPATLPALAAPGPNDMDVSAISSVGVQALIAETLLTSGEIGRAEGIYRALRQSEPENPDVLGGLGTIALMRGDHDSARGLWKAAIAGGIRDSFLCYRYAMLAQSAGLPEEDTRPSLERAIALRPNFDDARYALALSLSNTSEFERALQEFLDMGYVSPARCFSYWAAVSYAYSELDRRPEAISAANKALELATTADEQTRARQLAYMAQTDLTVQVISDDNGHAKLATARKLHESGDWNPFIQPGDRIRTIDAKLIQVNCESGKIVGIGLSTGAGNLSLAIPDPSHVQMLNAPAEFFCGPQLASQVKVVYAASELIANHAEGIVRGLQFR